MNVDLRPTDPDSLISDVLVPADRLVARVAELGAEVSRDYAGTDLLLVGVLKGAVFFMADLVRQMTVPCEIDFMAVSSYGNSTDSSGVVRILKDLDASIEGRNVLIVEDIVDSGLTLSYLMRNLEARGPASLEVCALLTKPARRVADIECRYVGFEIPNRFAIGYGLDFGERYRSLPFVAALDESKLPADLRLTKPFQIRRRSAPICSRALAVVPMGAEIRPWYHSGRSTRTPPGRTFGKVPACAGGSQGEAYE